MTTKTLTFKIMDHTGHSTEAFDLADAASLAAAQAKFDELVSERKFRAAKPKPGSPGTHELVKSFDPEAEQMLFIPQLKGG